MTVTQTFAPFGNFMIKAVLHYLERQPLIIGSIGVKYIPYHSYPLTNQQESRTDQRLSYEGKADMV